MLPTSSEQQQKRSAAPSLLSQLSTTPLTGLLITHCLAAAAAEVSAGSSGSKAVRHVAVRALQAVVLAVGVGQQLSFLLPGLASGITKQLLAAGKADASCHQCVYSRAWHTVPLVLIISTAWPASRGHED